VKKTIQTLYKGICTIEEALAMFCLLAATLILCVGAVCRALGNPLTSISEIALCMFAWCVFLGADTAYRRNKLVYVELLIDKAKPQVRRILYCVNYLLVGAFLALFVYESIRLVIHSWVRSWSSLPWLSYGWIALCMPVGCTLMLITTVIQFYQYVIKGNNKISETEQFLEDAKTDENVIAATTDN